MFVVCILQYMAIFSQLESTVYLGIFRSLTISGVNDYTVHVCLTAVAFITYQ
jgi:hypothetical protein